jgi:diacylglycerol kinase (ATP)
MSARIGILSNSRSKRNKISMRDFNALLAEHPEVAHVSFDSIEELPNRLNHLAALGISHLVISGGDGTVLATISQIVNSRPFARAPSLSLLSAGMTNVIAHEVGLPDLPANGLRRLVTSIASGKPGETIERSTMSIDFGDGRPIARGFLMGAIGFYQGTELARRDIHALGFKHFFAARLGIAWSLIKYCCLAPAGFPDSIARISPVRSTGMSRPETAWFSWQRHSIPSCRGSALFGALARAGSG